MLVDVHLLGGVLTMTLTQLVMISCFFGVVIGIFLVATFIRIYG